MAADPEVLGDHGRTNGVGEAVAGEIEILLCRELEGIGFAHGETGDGDILAGEGASLRLLALGAVVEGPAVRLGPVGGEAQDDRAVLRTGDTGEIYNLGFGSGGVGGPDRTGELVKAVDG